MGLTLNLRRWLESVRIELLVVLPLRIEIWILLIVLIKIWLLIVKIVKIWLLLIKIWLLLVEIRLLLIERSSRSLLIEIWLFACLKMFKKFILISEKLNYPPSLLIAAKIRSLIEIRTRLLSIEASPSLFTKIIPLLT